LRGFLPVNLAVFQQSPFWTGRVAREGGKDDLFQESCYRDFQSKSAIKNIGKIDQDRILFP